MLSRSSISALGGGDPRSWRNVAVLVSAQALLGAQMPLLFTVAALVGTSLAPWACLATLPISFIVLGSMISATPLSSLMQTAGRRAGFLVGAGGGALGAALSAWGMILGNFWLFLAGSLLTGVYLSAHGFYRFAATDTASEAFRPKAISFVMAGGLFGALIGTQLVKLTAEMFVIPFLGTYAAAITINVLGAVLFFGLDIPKPEKPTGTTDSGRSRRELLRDPRISVAIIVAMVGYALMNLVMTSTPLAVVGCGFATENAADVVFGHVVAMYGPSFVTGWIIARLGVERVMLIGLLLLASAGGVALAGVELVNFFLALILLGVGWNFAFIGATTLLAASHRPEERGRAQGLNDMMVFGCVFLASIASGGLMNCSGGSPVEGWTAVNLAMLPFLTLAGAAMLWLAMRRRAGVV